MWDNNNFPEVACSLVSIILMENNIELSNEKFEKVFQTTNLKIDQFWYSWFFTKTIKKSSDEPNNVRAIPEKIEKKTIDNNNNQEIKEDSDKEDSDEDMGFGLFD